MPSLEARLYTAARRLIAEELPHKAVARDLEDARDWVAGRAATEALADTPDHLLPGVRSESVRWHPAPHVTELAERIAAELLPTLSGVNLNAYVHDKRIVIIDLDVETFPEFHVAELEHHGHPEDEGEATATLTAAGWETTGPWLRSFYGGDIYTRVIRTTKTEEN